VHVHVVHSDDTAAMQRLLAAAARFGTPRHRSVDSHREAMDGVADHICVLVDDDDGTELAVGVASVNAVLGLHTAHVNIFAPDGADDAFACLLHKLDLWAAKHDVTAMVGHVMDPTPSELARWQVAGFDRVGERSRVVRTVTEADLELERVDPAGVRVVQLREHPELLADAERLWADVHHDIPSALGFDMADAPSMRRELGIAVGDELPEWLLAAVADAGELVGIACLVPMHGGSEAGHRFTGVAPDWRGRGVARALKVELLRWAATAGITRVFASNDEHNPAMRRVNDDLGYEQIHRIVLLRRDIPT
jgi:GNAT superfamily N-acetyltransferase